MAAGLVANYFKFPIFLNISFMFGSIFAMLALQIFGTVPATLAAAVIASYTYFLWNHPYAIVTMTVEVAVVGLLTRRFRIGYVAADAIYWLCLGMPLVYALYDKGDPLATVEDAGRANELFQILMGEEVEPRRQYIQEHAVEVTNLDI